jgi:peptidoglycan/LPS O-acetylase OafA/YrhL
MIQRIQSIWLLLAAACGFTTLIASFYIGSSGTLPVEHFTAKDNLLLLIFTVIAATLSAVAIFLYKNRPLQIKLGFAALALSIINIVLFFVGIKKYTSGGIALESVAAFIVPVFIILSIRAIWKDERLVKSTDRLR